MNYLSFTSKAALEIMTIAVYFDSETFIKRQMHEY